MKKSIITMAVFASACASSASATYQAALLRCVDRAETLAESKACRENVDGQYGVKDGGK